MGKEVVEKKARNKREKRDEHFALSEKLNNEKRMHELTNALKEEKKRSEDYLNRLKYMQADLENLKKRQDRQLHEVRKYGNEHLIIEMLGILDELEVAVQESKQKRSVETLLKGVEMTLKKLKKVLELEQVSPIDCIGQTFDPSKHKAIAKIVHAHEEEGKIIEEVRKGYTLKEKVIRPSIVKIAVSLTSKSLQEKKANEQ